MTSIRTRDLPDASCGAPRAPEPPPFAHFGPGPLTAALAGMPAARVEEFTASWDDLPADAHLGTDTPYRFRRYGSFRLRGDRLERLPHAAFFQDRSVNRVNGGVNRLFAPLREPVAAGEPLRAVVLALRDRLPGPSTGIDTCGVHQIRVTATVGAEGHPAPEGVHQDGHSYVAQVLIRRRDVRGAESCLYDLRRRPVHRALLTAPLETIVLDDRRVLHGVSPVRPAPGATSGVRDMLLVDFFAGAEESPEAGPTADG
ncbi:2OG-Fe dioxygenase family protein [Streptomyces sp. ISL-11]|uniref:2OG-Fe dioxygenase family protein n=1 Tax=Streptomyces sp. ISL-11 TaxID=2819174 RepID=UPI001BE951AC|nr:2OG-Fe dioxygenase family protein [Streptomyces sp. ISL-11]MBT2383952.1 2OG-Fe dioxygenase family protein [Streptomyces sp. ISL-11]